MTTLKQLTKSWAFGTLSAAITDSALSLSVSSGQGSRFDSIGASEHYYLLIIDQNETSNPYGAWEIVKATVKSSDTFTIGARAQGGSTAKQFPVTSGNPVGNVLVKCGDNIDQLREMIGTDMRLYAHGSRPATPAAGQASGYARDNSALVTLLAGADESMEQYVIEENGLVMRPGHGFAVLADQDHNWSALAAPEVPLTVYITPTAARTITLFTTKTPLGFPLRIVNLAATAGLNIIVNSSGGNRVWVVCPGNQCELLPAAKTPTTAANWRVSNPGWPIHARVHKSADQSNIVENTPVKITFDTSAFDPAGMFVDANDRLILPVSGWWKISGSAHATGALNTTSRIAIYFNGAEVSSADTAIVATTTAEESTLKVLGFVNVTVPGTDYVELFIRYVADGTDLGDVVEADSLFTTNKITWLNAEWTGPS